MICEKRKKKYSHTPLLLSQFVSKLQSRLLPSARILATQADPSILPTIKKNVSILVNIFPAFLVIPQIKYYKQIRKNKKKTCFALAVGQKSDT